MIIYHPLTSPMSTLQYTIEDAFTSTPFRGNPAAVVVLPPSTIITDLLAQSIAAEFNLSETAFVAPRAADGAQHSRTFRLRWFTPKNEVPLCGHATLATARVLFADFTLAPEGSVTTLRFETLSGTLEAQKVSGTTYIQLEFPAYTLTSVDVEELEKVARTVNEAVGGSVDVIDVLKAGRFLLVRLDAAFDLENASVNPWPFVSKPSIITCSPPGLS